MSPGGSAKDRHKKELKQRALNCPDSTGSPRLHRLTVEREATMTRFEIDQIIIPLYIDSAQVYLQLSIGALALSIIFREKVLGEKGPMSVGILLLASWVCFLLTIGASAFYQYLAIKFLDTISEHAARIRYFANLVRSPGKVYGAMLVFFFLGSILLVASSTKQLFFKRVNIG